MFVGALLLLLLLVHVPGYLLLRCFWRRPDWIDAVPASFVVGMGMWVYPILALYFLNAPLIYIFPAWGLLVAIPILIKRVGFDLDGSVSTCRYPFDAQIILVLFLSAVAALIAYYSSHYFAPYFDTWRDLAAITKILSHNSFFSGSPYYKGLFDPAYVYNPWFPLEAAAIKFSGSNIVEAFSAFTGLMTFQVCLALFAAARLILSSREAAYYTVLYFLFYYLIISNTGDREVYFVYFAKNGEINDFVVYPICLSFLFVYLKEHSRGALTLFCLSFLSLLSIHTYHAMFLLLSMGGMAATYLVFRQYRQMSKVVLAGLISLVTVFPFAWGKLQIIRSNTLPLFSHSITNLKSNYENYWIAWNDNFGILNYKLWLADYSLVWAVLLFLFAVPFLRINKIIKLGLIGAIIGPAFLVFNPWLAPIMAKLVSPYIVHRWYRYFYSFLITGCIINELLCYMKNIPRVRNSKIWQLSPAILTLSLLLVFTSTITDKTRAALKGMFNGNNYIDLSSFEQSPLIKYLRQEQYKHATIAADPLVAFHLSAFAPFYTVLAKNGVSRADGPKIYGQLAKIYDSSTNLGERINFLKEQNADYLLIAHHGFYHWVRGDLDGVLGVTSAVFRKEFSTGTYAMYGFDGNDDLAFSLSQLKSNIIEQTSNGAIPLKVKTLEQYYTQLGGSQDDYMKDLTEILKKKAALALSNGNCEESEEIYRYISQRFGEPSPEVQRPFDRKRDESNFTQLVVQDFFCLPGPVYASHKIDNIFNEGPGFVYWNPPDNPDICIKLDNKNQVWVDHVQIQIDYPSIWYFFTGVEVSSSHAGYIYEKKSEKKGYENNSIKPLLLDIPIQDTTRFLRIRLFGDGEHMLALGKIRIYGKTIK